MRENQGHESPYPGLCSGVAGWQPKEKGAQYSLEGRTWRFSFLRFLTTNFLVYGKEKLCERESRGDAYLILIGIECATPQTGLRIQFERKKVMAIKIPLQITFKNMAPSDAIETRIREAAAKLEVFSDDVMGCRVLVETPHKHHRKGKRYHVRLDLTVPGDEFVIKREPKLIDDRPSRHPTAPDDIDLGENRELSKYAAHDDIHIAIRDAFDAARRKLQDYARRRRGVLKAHEGPTHARVSKLFPDEGFGFLETADGREIYFHSNSVLDSGFGGLEIGTEVHFVEELGEKGPQATTVTPVTHHGR